MLQYTRYGTLGLALFQSLGIRFGLRHHGIPEEDLEALSQEAMEDPCHAGNLVPVTREDMLAVYKAAY